jgi:tetratricopeptide (TPR) repeat protein
VVTETVYFEGDSMKKNSTTTEKMVSEGEAVRALIAAFSRCEFSIVEHDAKALLKRFSKSPDILSLLGLALRGQGRVAEALEPLKMAVFFSPNWAEGFNNIGVVEKSLGKMNEAETAYRRAIEIKPNFAAAYCNLGNALKEMGRIVEATSCYQQALKIKPDLAEAHNYLSVIHKELGQLEEAEAHSRRALAINPNYGEGYYNLSNVLLALGRMKEAHSCLTRALELNPSFPEAYNNLGTYFNKIGTLEEEEVCYRNALKLNPQYTDALNNLAANLNSQGRLDEAERYSRFSLRINPANTIAHNNLGLILSHKGEADEAIRCFRDAIKYRNDWSLPYFNLHALLLSQKTLSASIECLERAIEYGASDHSEFYLGLLLDYAGRTEEAEKHFKMVAESGSGKNKAMLDAWHYLRTKIPKPIMTGMNIDTFRLGLKAASLKGLVLEFGVRYGASIRQIASIADQDIHGFDSFQGLPESWHNEPKGSYSTHGVIPIVPENVRLYAGWFEDTLPAFLKEHRAPARLINIDCDVYSSTKTVLDYLAERIIEGTVIIFDEYLGNENWREDEFKAFQEAVDEYGWCYEYLGFSFFTKQVVVRIL